LYDDPKLAKYELSKVQVLGSSQYLINTNTRRPSLVRPLLGRRKSRTTRGLTTDS
jgi:hypothetical protein